MNSGHAINATLRLVLWSGAALIALFLAAWAGQKVGGLILDYYKIFIGLWAAFLVAVVYLSRDPDPVEPTDLNAIVAPAHGKVDVIEDTVESEFMKGGCKRLSLRVALTNVQVQYAPITATIAHLAHHPAGKGDATATSENLFVGFDVIGRQNTRAAVRLIAGTWGKRILPWIKSNDVVSRSVRIAMMRPASRVDLYLPSQVKLHVNVGDEVAGGQSVVAKFE